MKSYLSKTDIVSYLRCPLKLWLGVNNPDVIANEDNIPMIINGDLAGEKAREQFSNGVLVEWENKKTALDITKKLMSDKSVNTIYEATFLAKGILVRADILVRNNDSWNLIEVKSTSKLTNHHYEDATIQRFIIEEAGTKIKATTIMYINKEFVYNGDKNYTKLFKLEYVDDKCDENLQLIKDAIKSAKKVIKNKKPVVEMAPMCKQAFVCGGKKYCESLAPQDHISFLPRGGTVQKKLAVTGKTRISEIPKGLLKSQTHIKVYDVTIMGHESYIPGAQKKIDDLPYPFHFFDVETIQFSVPCWKGVKPWRQIPFQWSGHVFYENGKTGYEKFIDVSGNDPRRAFADSLVKQFCNDEGTVFVYNQAFERMILMELLIDFPDIATELESIRGRCFDLLPIMKEHYYDPKMKGSWSIKKVLNCFVPEMSYDDLEEVHDGLEAQASYLNLIDPNWTGDKENLKKNALKYCEYDTLSMVKLVENIRKRET